jgi:hypothetical protein
VSGTYDSAVVEAKALLGDQKALKGATAVCIFKNAEEVHFAVRATRADALKSEGFIEVARIDSGGNIIKL